ncbi:peptide-N4-(N-acetyl-beta- glucosaminyl)asparagine amidase [Tulasnella sp. 427]|nr:peptide-N4-(N-acetyl-beta- glucosaminyl)asparagine amidase [Tulasnella sp. 427]
MFPIPNQFLQQSPKVASSDPGDSFQWEKFDDLFDKVFASPSKQGPDNSDITSETSSSRFNTMPGGFNGRRLFRSMSSGGESSSEESFDHAWDDAVKKAKKTVTTTTKRRIIRHTPAPSKLEMPTPTPQLTIAGRSRFPKTPYPQNDDSQDESSDGLEKDEQPTTLSVPSSRIVLPKSPNARSAPKVSFLEIPATGLTPELHSPVKYVPEWKREPRLDPYIPPESPWVTTTFDMPEGLTKNDIRVSFTTTYGAEKITVSWQHIEIVEFVEAGKLVREKKERKYHRTLPLPKGIKFEHVTANLIGGVLTITYPRSLEGDLRRIRPVELNTVIEPPFAIVFSLVRYTMNKTELNALIGSLTQRWIQYCGQRGLGSPRTPTVEERLVITVFVASLGQLPASPQNQRTGGSSAQRHHGLEDIVLHLDKQMDLYERGDLLDLALEAIPLQELHSAAEASVEAQEVPGYEDGLADALVKWFKRDYFQWVDPINCPNCGGKTALREMGTPTAEETQGGAVWNLEDHVWDEYFSPSLGRWIHLDPCERVRDEPLLYDKGWGKKMSYVLAFAIDGAKDVTRGYVQDWNATLARRTKGPEEALHQVLESVTRRRRLGLPPSEIARLEAEDEVEAKWLLDSEDRAKAPQPIDGQGRESGTAEWKHERGEDGAKQ